MQYTFFSAQFSGPDRVAEALYGINLFGPDGIAHHSTLDAIATTM